MRGHESQWFSPQMNGLNPGKFIKNLGTVCDLLLNTVPDTNWAELAVLYLAGRSQMAPTIFDFFNFPRLR